MITVASVSFKVDTFESIAVATPLSILKAVVPASAVGRILKWKIAITPLAVGFCPPERIQAYEYGFSLVHWSVFPDSVAALPASGASPSISINCAGKTTSHFKAAGALPGAESCLISNVTFSPGAFVTEDTSDA